MYSSFSCGNFRCFSELSLTELGKFNFIIGPNNVGKTALLEAIRLLDDDTDSSIQNIRSGIFRDFFNDARFPITLTGKVGFSNRKTTIEILKKDRLAQGGFSTIPAGYACVVSTDEYGVEFATGFPPPEDQVISFESSLSKELIEKRLSNYLEQLSNPYLLEGIRLLEPKIQAVSIENIRNRYLVCATLDSGKVLPMNLMGEGINHLILTLATLLEDPQEKSVLLDKVHTSAILWDEIEHSYYPGFLIKLWGLIVEKAIGKDRQFFIVTHDHGFLEQVRLSQKDVVIYQLYRTSEDEVKVRRNK